MPLLRCMENIFKNMNISNEFWILGERRRKYTTEERRHLMQHPVSYETIIQRDQQRKAFWEVIQEGQVGLTYRAIEAMMLRKNSYKFNKYKRI